MNYFICILLIVGYESMEINNVCKSFSDYPMAPISKNCWYNPDVGTDMPKLVENHHIPIESYEVTTSDGYLLQLFRIPIKQKPKAVVYLQHPATASCTMWVDKGNISLGYVLRNAGYDVWMGNFRGSFYGRKHTYLNPDKDDAFWDFTFHEMGIYDIASQIDYIINKTNADNLVVVGHSMAATAAAIYASLMPDHASKYVNSFIMMAPAVYLAHVRSPARFLLPYSNIIYDMLDLANVKEVIPHSKMMDKVTGFCRNPIGNKLCSLLLIFWMGPDPGCIEPSQNPVLFTQNPAGLSLKTLYHFAQSAKSKQFRFFDFGKKGNTIYYNQTEPPKYPIENIRNRFFVMAGTRDYLVSPVDAMNFYNDLPNQDKQLGFVEVDGFNHMHFIYGQNLNEKINNPILEVFSKL